MTDQPTYLNYTTANHKKQPNDQAVHEGGAGPAVGYWPLEAEKQGGEAEGGRATNHFKPTTAAQDTYAINTAVRKLWPMLKHS